MSGNILKDFVDMQFDAMKTNTNSTSNKDASKKNLNNANCKQKDSSKDFSKLVQEKKIANEQAQKNQAQKKYEKKQDSARKSNFSSSEANKQSEKDNIKSKDQTQLSKRNVKEKPVSTERNIEQDSKNSEITAGQNKQLPKGVLLDDITTEEEEIDVELLSMIDSELSDESELKNRLEEDAFAEGLGLVSEKNIISERSVIDDSKDILENKKGELFNELANDLESKDEDLSADLEKDTDNNYDIETEVKTSDRDNVLDNVVLEDNQSDEDAVNINSDILAQNMSMTVDAENVDSINSNAVVLNASITKDNVASEVQIEEKVDFAQLESDKSQDKFVEIAQGKTQNEVVESAQEGLKRTEISDLIRDKNISIKIEQNSNTHDESVKIASNSSMNLILADNTKRGSKIISDFQESDKIIGVDQDLDKVQVEDDSNLLLDLDYKQDDGFLDNKTFKEKKPSDQFRFSEGKIESKSTFDSLDVSLQKINEESFVMDFASKMNQNNKSLGDLQKPIMQVSLAMKEMLDAAQNIAKKQVTINLHPQTLGNIKVEILSHAGQDGTSKIENIKIIAEQRETLMMLEERKSDLVKTLKEVNSAKEETAMQFEMNQERNSNKGQSSYFASNEERDSWMQQFSGLVSEDGKILKDAAISDDEYTTRGIMTNSQIDIVT